jgi:hypothetical protein
MPAPPPAPKPSPLAPFWQAAPSFLQSLVLLAVGFALTGQVELALKDRQATVASVTAMGDLLKQLVLTKADLERQDIVRRLAMYGVDAVDPLIMLGLTKLPPQYPAEGLSLIAIRHKAEVCASLAGALDRDQLFAEFADAVNFLRAFSVTKLECPQRGALSWRL